jgi:hypothetical protein
MYEEYYKPEDIKCRLIGHERCCTQTITFLNDTYREESYKNYLREMTSNNKIHKMVKVENGDEEVILEK